MMIGNISNALNPAYSYGNYASAYDSGMANSNVQNDVTPTAKADSADNTNTLNENDRIKPGYTSSPNECETCKERKYQDGSNESNVSFKSASHVSPEAAGSAVRAHEGQHVKNAYSKASKNNGEVLSASVSIHTAICPECGRVYVSGGTTKTSIKYPNESNPYQQNRKSADAASLIGSNINLSA